MKKITFMLFAFLSMTIGFAQGLETFDNATPLPTGTNYGDGSFVGEDGITWSYTHALSSSNSNGDFSIDSSGIILRRSDEPSSISATIQGGIGSFSVDTRKAFTGNTQRKLELVINGTVIQQFQPAFANGADATIVLFEVEDINIEGEFTLELRMFGATGNQQIVLDNIEWTGYTGSTPGYCIPTADSNTGTHGIITNVTFNDINNSTTDNDLAYQDYTAISTTVVQGESYDLSVTTAAGGMMFATKSVAWIDWDGDNVFESDEAYDLGQGSDFDPTTPLTIQIPADVLGEYRLRVRTYSFNSMMFPFDFDACENLNQSEAEDYTIIVEEESGSTPPPACDISVTISSAGWGDMITWNLLDGDGVAVLSGGDYGSNYSDNQTYIAINPPYVLQINHIAGFFCDNDVDYLVTIGGVTELSGTIYDPCSGGTANLPLTTDLTACIPDCPAPGNLLADNFTFTSAELSWTGDASLFDIEWGLEGFTQGSGTEVNNISVNTHTLTGLTAETLYDFYVRQNCGVDGFSTWAGPYTFFTGYCLVSTTYPGDYISGFSTSGAIQNVTYTATSQPAGSYANETAQIIQQAQGLPIDFTSSYVGGSYAFKIWVDVNNDLVFDETTEMVFFQYGASPQTGSVTVPIDLPIGDYRVRVRGEWGSTANPPACGEVLYGSTIDFTLQVTAAPSCLPPSDLSATTTSNSATLSWISTGTLFDIEYGATGFTQGTGTPINEVTNPYTLNGLNIGGSYDYYVRQNCGNGDESIWVGPYSFTVGAYQGGDIPTQSGTSASITVNSTDYCTPEPTLTIDVPVGMQIASLQVQYSMTAHNGSWMSEQRSFIYSPTLNIGEATMTSGTGTSAGTLEYNRSMDFANGVTGSVDFVLRAWRTWSTSGEEGCSTYNNYVNNGTWVITPTFEPFVDPCAGILAPTGDAAQDVELNDTLADLDVTGTDLTWYSDAALITEVAETLVFDQVGEFTYYVTQTVGDCTSDALAITVTVVDPCADVTPPTADSPQTLTDGQTVADIMVTDVTGTLNWYADEDLTIEVDTDEMLTEGAYTFWVTQTVGDCTSDATEIQVEVTLSTDGFDNVSFRTYPNPVKDIFNISYSKEITNVSVVNMLGQIVIEKAVNTTDTQIDMTSLASGSYFVKVTVEGNTKTVKVMKQ